MPAKSSKKFEILRRRRQIAELYVQRYTQAAIAEKLRVSQATVAADIKRIRREWRASTLRDFDAMYDDHRDQLPSRRRPSEWWQSNCLAGVSFMHKAEVEMLDEIGADKVSFGRDYPHAEGTWPNTGDYLRDLLAGVPEADVRKILGENAIQFFGLDEARIAAIAERVGPQIEEITASPDVDPALVEHLDLRCGYLKPAEGGSRLGELDELLRDDLVRMAPSSA